MQTFLEPSPPRRDTTNEGDGATPTSTTRNPRSKIVMLQEDTSNNNNDNTNDNNNNDNTTYRSSVAKRVEKSPKRGNNNKDDDLNFDALEVSAMNFDRSIMRSINEENDNGKEGNNTNLSVGGSATGGSGEKSTSSKITEILDRLTTADAAANSTSSRMRQSTSQKPADPLDYFKDSHCCDTDDLLRASSSDDDDGDTVSANTTLTIGGEGGGGDGVSESGSPLEAFLFNEKSHRKAAKSNRLDVHDLLEEADNDVEFGSDNFTNLLIRQEREEHERKEKEEKEKKDQAGAETGRKLAFVDKALKRLEMYDAHYRLKKGESSGLFGPSSYDQASSDSFRTFEVRKAKTEDRVSHMFDNEEEDRYYEEKNNSNTLSKTENDANGKTAKSVIGRMFMKALLQDDEDENPFEQLLKNTSVGDSSSLPEETSGGDLHQEGSAAAAAAAVAASWAISRDEIAERLKDQLFAFESRCRGQLVSAQIEGIETIRKCYEMVMKVGGVQMTVKVPRKSPTSTTSATMRKNPSSRLGAAKSPAAKMTKRTSTLKK